MVISPKGKHFIIDVKGLYSGNVWLIEPEPTIIPNLYYVLAFVPPHAPNEFFVLSQETANGLIRGTSFTDIRRGALKDHIAKWNVLPDWPEPKRTTRVGSTSASAGR